MREQLQRRPPFGGPVGLVDVEVVHPPIVDFVPRAVDREDKDEVGVGGGNTWLTAQLGGLGICERHAEVGDEGRGGEKECDLHLVGLVSCVAVGCGVVLGVSDVGAVVEEDPGGIAVAGFGTARVGRRMQGGVHETPRPVHRRCIDGFPEPGSRLLVYIYGFERESE